MTKGNPDGFYPSDGIPLVSTARRDWDKILCPGTLESMTCGDQVPDKYWSEFAVTPDTNYYMLMGMVRHNVPHIAVPATLGHLKLNNMEWGIPIAPESREADFVVWGDQYSNFNAGKLIPLIEGIGGFKVSIGNSTFTQVDALPQEWSSMEWRMPIRAASATDTDWVLVKEERFCSGESNVHTKQITIESNPLDELFLSPWTEGATVLSWTVLVDGQESNVQADENVGQDRLGFRFSSDDAKKKIVISVVLQVDASADLSGISCITTKAPTSGPSQSPSNGPSLLPSNEVSIFLIFYTLANFFNLSNGILTQTSLLSHYISQPTQNPSPSPSKSPSMEPSVLPLANPTAVPTASPSKVVSLSLFCYVHIVLCCIESIS